MGAANPPYGLETYPIANASVDGSNNKRSASGGLRGNTRAMRNREASMNRKTAGIVFALGVQVAMLAGTASAQNPSAAAALDASLRAAVERKDVPGVVALVTWYLFPR